MTDSLSLNTNLLNAPQTAGVPAIGTQTAGMPAATSGASLFNPLQSNSSAYTNDFMMSGFDFNSLVYDEQSGSIFQKKTAQNQQAQIPAVSQPQVNNGVHSFTSAAPQQNQQVPVPTQNGQLNLSELDNYLVKDQNTAAAQTPTNIGKKIGTGLGFLAPIAERAIAGLKSGSVVKALNLKQLAVTCPIVALAGFGIGYLADGIINTIKGNKSQPAQQAPQTQQQAVPQQLVQQQQYKPLQIAA